MKRTSVAAFVAIVALAFIGTVNATNGVSRETTAAAGIVQRPVASESLLERRGGRECGGCVATFEELQAMLSMPGMLGSGSTTTINLCKSTKETALVLMSDLIITGTDITVHFKCCGSQEAMMARPFKAKKAERQGRCQITRVMKPSGEPTKIMFETTASGEVEGFMAHSPKIMFSSIWFAESIMAWEWPLGGPVLQSRGMEAVFYFNCMFTDFKSKITEGPSGAVMVTPFTHSVRFEFCSFMRNQQTETESAVLIEEFGHPLIMEESVNFWVLHTHFDDVGSGNNIRSASMFFLLKVEHSAFSFGLAEAYAER